MTVLHDHTPGPDDGARSGARAPARVGGEDALPAEARAGAWTKGRPGPGARLTGSGVHRLQRLAGNRAVSQLVAQRRAAAGGGAAAQPQSKPAEAAISAPTADASAPAVTTEGHQGGHDTPVQARGADAPPAPPSSPDSGPHGGGSLVVQRKADGGSGGRRSPQGDPKFARLKADVRSKQKKIAAHPPAKAEAANAQGAAKAPADDKVAQGKAANAEKMHAAKPGSFDKAGFIAAVNEAIAAQAPKNLDEADNFGDSGKADAVKGAVQGKVNAGKETSAKAIETTTKAPPDTSAAKDKKVEPLKTDKAPPAPPGPNPTDAVPDKAPPEATDFSDGPKQVDQEMADAEVTEEQLAKSNEPEFTGALKEKKETEKHAATAPKEVRAAEAKTLAGAKSEAAAEGAQAMGALAADRKQTGAAIDEGKEGAKSEDEVKRTKVTAILQKVFDATKKDVETILTGLDGKVDAKFSSGEKAARDAFTADHKRRMEAYKDKRYSGLRGKARWVKDKFAGLPAEADQIFVEARKGYVARMQQVISAVADVIGAELDRAKARIAQGRNELQAEVRKLPADLQALGKKAAGEFSSKFDELTESVDAKGSELVQTLASKYNEALKAVDAEIDAEKEKNKGLVAKAIGAVKGVIETIMRLKDMLMGVLAKAASAIKAILKDPIGFLGNLISAVGAGLKAFMSKIGEHLKKGLLGWLLGAMAAAGVTLPDTFDLKGLIVMIGSMLGLTWAALRGRIAKKGVPEPAMDAVEKTVPVAQKLQSQGIGGIWEDIKAKVGDLKETLFSKISEYLIPTVLIAGITWILSLLNPASAFIKACKMIVDIVMFIVTQGAQIVQFVNAVLDAVVAIATGGGGGVPALVENALAKSIPVLIGAFAAILGIGGIAAKIQKFFKALAKPVGKAVDFVVDKIAALGKKLWAKLKSKFAKKKGKDGKEGAEDTADKQKRLDAGVAAGVSLVNRFSGRTVGERLIKPLLVPVKLRYRMTSLTAVNENGTWAVEGVVNPKKKAATGAKGSSTAGLDGLRKAHQVAQNTIKNELKKRWNNNSIKKAIAAAKPDDRAVLTREFNRLTNALGGKTEATYDALMTGAPTNADVPKMFAMYRAHTAAAESLMERLQDLTRSPAELGAEAATLKTKIENDRATSKTILAKPPVHAAVELPTSSSLKSRIGTRGRVIDDALPKLGARSLPELRTLADTMRKLLQDANDAEALTNVTKSIEPTLAKIDNICLNTTKAGKEDANVDDGSSEAAAKQEARTGKDVKGKAHGPKCKMEAKGLRDAIKVLADLRTLTTDAGLLGRIDKGITKAKERADGLDTGAEAWDARVANDPDGKVWHPTGESKVQPGFGKGI